MQIWLHLGGLNQDSVQSALLNSDSKYVEQFGLIKEEAQLTWAGKELCLGKSGPIKRDAQLSIDRFKQDLLYFPGQ